MFLRCTFTVPSVRPIAEATSAFVIPRDTNRSTSSSRGVSATRGVNSASRAATTGGAVGADVERVRADMQEQAFEQRIRGDFLSGVRSGVNGTPTFFINGARFTGDWTDEEAFASAIRHALAGPHPRNLAGLAER